jgi:hypothetical protein
MTDDDRLKAQALVIGIDPWELGFLLKPVTPGTGRCAVGPDLGSRIAAATGTPLNIWTDLETEIPVRQAALNNWWRHRNVSELAVLLDLDPIWFWRAGVFNMPESFRLAAETESSVYLWSEAADWPERLEAVDRWMVRKTLRWKEGMMTDEEREMIYSQARELGVKPEVLHDVLTHGYRWLDEASGAKVAVITHSELRNWTEITSVPQRQKIINRWWNGRLAVGGGGVESAETTVTANSESENWNAGTSADLSQKIIRNWRDGRILAGSGKEDEREDAAVQEPAKPWYADPEIIVAQAEILDMQPCDLYWLLNTDRGSYIDTDFQRISEATQTPANLWVYSDEDLNHRRAAVAAWWKSRQALKAAWKSKDWSGI